MGHLAFLGVGKECRPWDLDKDGRAAWSLRGETWLGLPWVHIPSLFLTHSEALLPNPFLYTSTPGRRATEGVLVMGGVSGWREDGDKGRGHQSQRRL